MFDYLNKGGVSVSVVESHLVNKPTINKETKVCYVPDDGTIYRIIFGMMNHDSVEKNTDYCIKIAKNKIDKFLNERIKEAIRISNLKAEPNNSKHWSKHSDLDFFKDKRPAKDNLTLLSK